MLEIEMKFAVADFSPVITRLGEWGAVPAAAHDEADHYYNAPDRDFGQTDEALRLRRIGTANHITYKGPKEPGPTKTRAEIEVALADGNAAAEGFLRILERLGYRATAVVCKRRTDYSLNRGGFDMHVCLDEVDRIGRFVEVEIVADPKDRDAAQKTLQETARELGLDRYEPRSYLRMTLERGA